jgi:hypothetical protein
MAMEGKTRKAILADAGLDQGAASRQKFGHKALKRDPSAS